MIYVDTLLFVNDYQIDALRRYTITYTNIIIGHSDHDSFHLSQDNEFLDHKQCDVNYHTWKLQTNI